MRAILCAIVLMAFGAAAAVPLRAAPNTPATPKLNFVTAKDLAFAYVTLPASYRWSVKVSRPFGLANLSSHNRCRGFAMTGGYTTAENPRPAGFIQLGGKRVSPEDPRADGGAVILDRTRVALLRTSQRSRWSAANGHIIQSHPILIHDGKIDHPLLDPRKANRVGLGKLRNGSTFMMIAYNGDRGGTSAVTLLEFATKAKAIFGDGIDWMMNFDGGPSAFLVSPRQTIAPSAGAVSSYLCAEPAR